MNNKVIKLFCCCFLVILFKSNPLFASIKLPAIIGDNMVLQQGIKVPLWGWADPGDKIEIIFMNKKYEVTASDSGKWFTRIGSYHAGGPYQMIIKDNSGQVVINDILIGDVWVASGQSNMEFGIQTERHAAQAIPKADNTSIHFFYVPMASSLHPEDDIDTMAAKYPNGKWVVCSPQIMANPKWAWHGFSAVGYYFAQQIQNFTGYPIGMIATYKGGTPAQAWVSIQGLQQTPAFTKYVQRHQELVAHYSEAMAAYPARQLQFEDTLKKWNAEVAPGFNAALAQWKTEALRARDNGEQPPPPPKPTRPRPQAPAQPDGGFGAPANLYNAMVVPIIHYGIKGVIWYQGESNGDRLADAVEYNTLFKRLITDWRKNWHEGNFPFLFVQLPYFRKAAVSPSEGNWPWVREAQLNALSLPNTGMAVTIDLGDANTIHPTNKLDVGKRLALVAEHVVYKADTVYSGPVYRKMKKEGNTIKLFFKDTGKGLVAEDSTGNADTVLKGFGIAGPDKVFVWAKAVIEGNSVVVSSDNVPDPQAVRYDWADNPPGNLYNKNGLPASPFRTDNWPPPLSAK